MTLNKGRVQGPTIILSSGKYFDIENPLAVLPKLDDVAWGLAFEGRWAGQCISRASGEHVFYSVGQHILDALPYVDEELKFPWIMHEIEEWAFGDLCGPLKQVLPDYKGAAKFVRNTLLEAFGVPNDPDTAAKIKAIDRRQFATEKRDLCAQVDPNDIWEYSGNETPFPNEIVPRGSTFVAREYIIAFHRYAPPETVAKMTPAVSL